MADILNLQVGEMSGHSRSATGFPSNLQIGLAGAVNSGIPYSREAWAKFESRSVKPTNFDRKLNFEIVPTDTPLPENRGY